MRYEITGKQEPQKKKVRNRRRETTCDKARVRVLNVVAKEILDDQCSCRKPRNRLETAGKRQHASKRGLTVVAKQMTNAVVREGVGQGGDGGGREGGRNCVRVQERERERLECDSILRLIETHTHTHTCMHTHAYAHTHTHAHVHAHRHRH